MKDLVPPELPMLYGQRRQNVPREITFRTDSSANSFFPDSVKNWNRIGISTRLADPGVAGGLGFCLLNSTGDGVLTYISG